MIDKIKQYAKFVAAILGAIAVSFAGLIPDGWAPWIQAVIALATAISVLAIPNALTDDQVISQARHLEDPGAVAARLVTEVNLREGFGRK